MELKETVRRVFIGKVQASFKYWNEKKNEDNTIPFSSMNLSLEEILSLWRTDYLEELDYKDAGNPNDQTSVSNGSINNTEIGERTEGGQNTPIRLLSPREVRIDRANRIATILFDAIDPHGADVTYKNYKTRVSRRNRKREFEGINYSAHLVIKIDGTNGLYDAAFEDVPYLTINVINQLLSKMVRIIRRHNKELFEIPSPTGIPDKNGRIKREACRLQLSFHPVPDNRFWDMVSHREAIASLELVKTTPQNDDDIPLEIKRQSVVFSLPPQSFFDTPRNNFLKILSFGRNHSYDAFKVTIKTDTGNCKTVWFNTDKGLDGFESFLKMELIEGLTEKMATATESINEELVGKMKDILS